MVTTNEFFEIFGNEICFLEVGPEGKSQHFSVHLNLLRRTSKLFRDNEESSQEVKAALRSCHWLEFEAYFKWVYGQQMTGRDLCVDMQIVDMINLYNFAARIECENFQNAIIDKLAVIMGGYTVIYSKKDIEYFFHWRNPAPLKKYAAAWLVHAFLEAKLYDAQWLTQLFESNSDITSLYLEALQEREAMRAKMGPDDFLDPCLEESSTYSQCYFHVHEGHDGTMCSYDAF